MSIAEQFRADSAEVQPDWMPKKYTPEQIQQIIARTPKPVGTRAERRRRLLEILSITEEDCAAFYRRAAQQRR